MFITMETPIISKLLNNHIIRHEAMKFIPKYIMNQEGGKRILDIIA